MRLSLSPACAPPSALRALPLALCAACAADTGFSNKAEPEEVQEGAGEIEVSPAVLEIADVPWNPPIDTSGLIEVTNLGTSTLQVYGFSLVENPTTELSPEGVLFLEEVGELDLAPGASREVVVVARLKEPVEVVGRLKVSSGDSDERDVFVEVRVSPEGGVDSGG